MAKAKASRSNSRRPADGGIQKHFTSSKRISGKSSPSKQAIGDVDDAAAAAAVSKAQQSGFHSYLRVAASAKDGDVAMQAAAILDRYRSMDQSGKRAMVSNFYRCGGKRPGLQNIYSQSVTHKALADKGSWEGYVTLICS